MSKLRKFRDCQSSKDYKDLEELFQIVRIKIKKDLEEMAGQTSEEKIFKHLSLSVSHDMTLHSIDIDDFNDYQNKLYQLVINEWLKNITLSSSDEIGQSRKGIIENIGKEIKALNFETSNDLKYLRKLYQSLNTLGIGFKINDTNAIPLQTLAFFISRYSENEKLKDMMDKNSFSQQSLVFGIWGAAYGYANTSKLILEPLTQNESHLEEVTNYIQQILNNAAGTVQEVRRDVIEKEEVPIYTQSWDLKTIEEPIESYGRKDKITLFEEFLRDDKAFIKKDDWIVSMLECYESVLKIDYRENMYEVKAFKDALIVQKKHLVNFGNKKVEHATQILENTLENFDEINKQLVNNTTK
jgi:hypothetical protein